MKAFDADFKAVNSAFSRAAFLRSANVAKRKHSAHNEGKFLPAFCFEVSPPPRNLILHPAYAHIHAQLQPA
ncbi:MAG: hypothetical protein JW942_01540 [Opitutales bacterium]|nr:hypothetical protein [Opitutales bacterium]